MTGRCSAPFLIFDYAFFGAFFATMLHTLGRSRYLQRILVNQLRWIEEAEHEFVPHIKLA